MEVLDAFVFGPVGSAYWARKWRRLRKPFGTSADRTKFARPTNARPVATILPANRRLGAFAARLAGILLDNASLVDHNSKAGRQ